MTEREREKGRAAQWPEMTLSLHSPHVQSDRIRLDRASKEARKQPFLFLLLLLLLSSLLLCALNSERMNGGRRRRIRRRPFMRLVLSRPQKNEFENNCSEAVTVNVKNESSVKRPMRMCVQTLTTTIFLFMISIAKCHFHFI